MKLTVDEAVRIGMELRRLTNGTAFHSAIEVLKEQYRSQIFDSQPEEVEKRETAYAEAHALDELLTTFNSFIAMADAKTLEIDEDQLNLFND